jgi:hypothetical protein
MAFSVAFLAEDHKKACTDEDAGFRLTGKTT